MGIQRVVDTRRIQRIDLHGRFLRDYAINRFAREISSARNLRAISSFENYLKSPTWSLSSPPVLIFIRFAFSLPTPSLCYFMFIAANFADVQRDYTGRMKNTGTKGRAWSEDKPNYKGILRSTRLLRSFGETTSPQRSLRAAVCPTGPA